MYTYISTYTHIYVFAVDIHMSNNVFGRDPQLWPYVCNVTCDQNHKRDSMQAE